MVFRRKGRPTLYFQGQTETGWKQLSTGTSNRTLANRIEAMWGALASEHRAWDLLGRVLSGAITIGALYDRWADSHYSIDTLRRNLEDVDLATYREEFLAVHRRGVKEDSADHVEAHLLALLPGPLMRSAVTPALLTARLYAYAGKRNTLRKVHSSWSVFFQYLTDVKGLFAANPMSRVERPSTETSPIRYYELDEVRRIVDEFIYADRRALLALLYGTGIDISTALLLSRGDVWDATKEVRAAGTKAHTRDRVVRVADWAWPYIAKHVATILPSAPLFPKTWSRWTVSDWHRLCVRSLGLRQIALRNARDHWAVRAARAGTPIAVIQHQLGHGSPMLTLTKYGRFLPSASDRAKWEREATKSDERSAKGSAKTTNLKLSNSRGGT